MRGTGRNECQPLAETERWQGNRNVTTDMGKVSAKAAGRKSECVCQGLFGLDDLGLLHHFILFFWVCLFTYRVSRKPSLFLPMLFLYFHTTVMLTSDTSGQQTCGPAKRFSDTGVVFHNLTHFCIILTLSTLNEGQISQVKGSVPQKLPPLPLQTPCASRRSPGYPQLLSNLAINQRFSRPPPQVQFIC